MISMNFGSKRKALRKSQKLTQQQLADRIGVAKPVVSYYESGNRYPSYDVLVRIAHIFHTFADYLLDVDTLKASKNQEADIKTAEEMLGTVYQPQQIPFDIDSTLLNAYGKQEGIAFNYHYQANGYHPLLCYDGLTGDLLKDYRAKYPPLPLSLRGDSGFASPDLYAACEEV